MPYILFNQNTKKIEAKGDCRLESFDCVCVEVSQEVYDNAEKYKLNDENETELKTPEELAEDERAQKQIEYQSWYDTAVLTGADVERALYKDKNMDFDDLIEFAKEKELDWKQLKIELKAQEFWRKHDFIEQIGVLLGYTQDDIDYLFKNKEFPPKEEKQV